MYFYNNCDDENDTRTILDPTLTVHSYLLGTRERKQPTVAVVESSDESNEDSSDEEEILQTIVMNKQTTSVDETDPTHTILTEQSPPVVQLNPVFTNAQKLSDPTRTISTDLMTDTKFLAQLRAPTPAVQTCVVSGIPPEEFGPNVSTLTHTVLMMDSPEVDRTIILSANDLKPKSQVTLVSYVDKKKRSICLGAKLGNGSYNNLFYFSPKQHSAHDDKLVIRVSNKQANSEIIHTEHRGVRLQYHLCGKSDTIGKVIDFGYVQSQKNEYAIMEKYGKSLRNLLESLPEYRSLDVIIHFMRQLLEGIHCIHQNGYVHLDLKPSNILLKKCSDTSVQCGTDSDSDSAEPDLVDSVDFVIIDFGAAQQATSDKSIFYKRQMASPAFSPPEVKKLLFGRKSDIWSYGVICYLFCIGKFFFQAKGSKLFLHPKPKTIIRNIHAAIDRIDTELIPDSLSKKQFLKSHKKSKIDTLKDFFKKIFVLDPNQRPNTTTLLQHPLFLP